MDDPTTHAARGPTARQPGGPVATIPVAIGLIGTGLKTPTIAYLGWFGPRGLASILFGLFMLEEAALPVGDGLFEVVILTVLASVVLHGVTSLWLSNRYGNWFAARRRIHMEEARTVEAMPTR